MKKFLITSALALVFALSALAQTNVPLDIKGSIDIKFNSRITKGAKDVYSLKVNVGNNTLFQGTITDTPQVIDGWVSKKVTQPRSLAYDINCDVVTPTRTTTLGHLYGKVGIDPDGTYRYDTGELLTDITFKGVVYSGKFGGTTVGKPLTRPANYADTLRQMVNIKRNVNGKTTTVSLTKYDKMDFRQHVIGGAGPIQIYQPVTVNGEMLYAYDKKCWFFNNVTMQYADGGVIKIDRLGGIITWSDKSNAYTFDIRVNEPPPKQDSGEVATVDELSVFETDTTIPALTGSMKYTDSVRGGVTVASLVNIDLKGNNITKQQVMSLCKIIVFSSVVPMNSD